MDKSAFDYQLACTSTWILYFYITLSFYLYLSIYPGQIEIQPQNHNPKKKRKMAEFFENEAELTSEDEWAGSGDEDEAGLDRMEREEGDDDTFHQGALQRELGQIHM